MLRSTILESIHLHSDWVSYSARNTAVYVGRLLSTPPYDTEGRSAMINAAGTLRSALALIEGTITEYDKKREEKETF